MSSASSTTRPDACSPLTVLFAPAHTLIDEGQFGSDYYWAYKIIQRLALDHGVQVIALTVQPQITHQLRGVRFVSVDPAGRVPATNMESLRFHLRCYAAARRILASGQRIDVIHHMLPFGFRATFNLLALCRRPSDPPLVIGPLQPPYPHIGGEEWHVSARGMSAPTSPTPAHRRMPPLSSFITTPVLSALSTRTLRHAAALVAVSERAARLYGSLASSNNVTIIPVGVDTEEFRPHLHTPLVPSEDGGRPVHVLACGHLVQRKGFDVLIAAMSTLVRVQMPVHLRLVGDGPARPSLEGLVHRLGLEHHVSFVGAVPHSAIAHEYRHAHIFCSPSFGEGFATVALEALASGLPIVATPTGGFREVINQHHVGTLVPFGAADELASALAELVAQKAVRETLARRARQIAVQEYDWRVIARRYLSVYTEVVLNQE